LNTVLTNDIIIRRAFCPVLLVYEKVLLIWNMFFAFVWKWKVSKNSVWVHECCQYI